MSKYIAVIPRAGITRLALVEAGGRSMAQVKEALGCQYIINAWFYNMATGKAVGNLNVPVVKGTNAILCFTKLSEASSDPVCIRCGKCVDVCPMQLQPLYLYRYARAEDKEMLNEYYLNDCMECGCCYYGKQCGNSLKN